MRERPAEREGEGKPSAIPSAKHCLGRFRDRHGIAASGAAGVPPFRRDHPRRGERHGLPGQRLGFAVERRLRGARRVV